MTHFDKLRLTEIVLYILNKTKGLDYYHVFKVIYFANVAHLAKYGSLMVSDDFCALPDGPVPSSLYNCVKGEQFCDKDMLITCLKQNERPMKNTCQKRI